MELGDLEAVEEKPFNSTNWKKLEGQAMLKYHTGGLEWSINQMRSIFKEGHARYKPKANETRKLKRALEQKEQAFKKSKNPEIEEKIEALRKEVSEQENDNSADKESYEHDIFLSQFLKDCLKRFNPAPVTSERSTGAAVCKEPVTMTVRMATSVSSTKTAASAASPSMPESGTSSPITTSPACETQKGMHMPPSGKHVSQSNTQVPPAGLFNLNEQTILINNDAVSDNART